MTPNFKQEGIFFITKLRLFNNFILVTIDLVSREMTVLLHTHIHTGGMNVASFREIASGRNILQTNFPGAMYFTLPPPPDYSWLVLLELWTGLL